MAASNLKAVEAIDKAWTVLGTYRDEEFADGGILEGPFAGVFCAPTSGEAESLAHEYNPWLEIHEVIPGAVGGVMRLTPESQLRW